MNNPEDYFDSEEFRKALHQYESAVAAGETVFFDIDVLSDITDYYDDIGDTERAMAAADYALHFNPSATLPNVYMARQALLNEDYDTARQHADNIDEKDEPDYHYLVAEILIAEGRLDEADNYLKECEKNVEADEYADFMKDCANLFVDYCIFEKAYEWMKRLKGDNSLDYKQLMARTLLGLSKFKEATVVLEEMVDEDPYCVEFWNLLSAAQFMCEDHSGSLTSSEYSLAIQPNNPDGLLNKANAQYMMDNFEGALETYDRYEETGETDGAALLNKALCLFNLHKTDEAVRCLQRALCAAVNDKGLMEQIWLELSLMRREKDNESQPL